ncbi:3-oxoacyl-[acyl-carrier-protein] reductase FabG [Thalassovita gelatinovora]|uniref:3-oxoacyl-[acyl-carrier-protein] reductase FabG n=1 Tax=Thalassovita gelatinovora TaxID=53501 RepID=A0A0P1G1K4_THAGE|nr:SDR family NAD(P)-dependent oxidoreductase [Thalassovita gelatinovora]QIZ82022.1 SDR family oxidoreductase [Thalassovita gelatinovora]CUH67494.1 3-oxoacyl-[acyl-carrier-protein] reductase FabG [Thalassovita gelatinovora]SEP72976.1 3-oxoacyl-[acyl-carrier protein] reductase [Thalassovita gelatinovora]
MIALVTGAGSGIGAAIADRLAADGHTVAVNDLSIEAAKTTVARIAAAGGTAGAYAADVSDEAAVNAMIETILEDFGAPEILVNNAGFGHQAPFVDISPDQFDRMFAVHVRGNYICTRATLPAMLEKGEGYIVNVASQLGQVGGVELVHYSGAKAAIIGMTKALAREVSDKGVRVNAVAPGPINTPLVEALSEDWKSAKRAELPLGRFGSPAEVAGTVSFLCSSDAALFVGQTLGPNSGDVML